MKTYRIKPEFLHLWGSETTTETVVTESDVERFASEWDVDLEDLRDELIEEGDNGDV